MAARAIFRHHLSPRGFLGSKIIIPRYNVTQSTIKNFNYTQLTTHRCLSSLDTPSAATLSTSATPPSAGQETSDHINSIKKNNRNILQQFPPGQLRHPGQAFFYLRKKGSGGAKNAAFIRKSEFRMMCKLARPNIPKDGHIILLALREFRRCNAFYIDTELAECAMEAIIRAYGEEQAGWVLGRAFVKEKTGLYYALKSDQINRIYEMMLLSQGEPMEGYDVALLMFEKLWARASFCENKLHKRARRKYLWLLQVQQVEDGPTVETVDLATRVCLANGVPFWKVEMQIFEKFDKWGRFQGLSVKDETRELVERKKQEDEAEKAQNDGEGSEDVDDVDTNEEVGEGGESEKKEDQ